MENLINNQLAIIHKLAELENTVGRLYEAYGSHFPVHKSLWQSLADEEKEHAFWLEKLGDYVLKGQVTMNEKRFNKFAAQSFLNYLKNELDKVTHKEVTIINAAVIALYLEESIIEHNFYEVVSGDSPELQKTFDSLTNATKTHLQRVKIFLNQLKSP